MRCGDGTRRFQQAKGQGAVQRLQAYSTWMPADLTTGP